MTRVLVVDDEPQILRALRINLRVRDYDVHVAATGAEALEVAGRYPPDLVILDLGLPDLDGVEVIQGLRGWTKAPIIVLSGRADSLDKVEALDAGERFGTPFGPAEVSHTCANDGIVEGIKLVDGRAFSVQYHPEAAAGPHDAEYLFDQFADLMAGEKH